MKTALALLCVEPNSVHLEFLNKLENYYDVYFVCDSEKQLNVMLPENSKIQIIQIDNKICRNAGYKNVGEAIKDVLSWDKAIYYFNIINTSYEHVWFLEDDVFIPDVNTLPNIDNKYEYADLLAASHNTYDKMNQKWHWWRCLKREHVPTPWHSSMCCAVRMSSKLISNIGETAKNKKTLYFLECLFNTTAAHHNMIVKTVVEMNTITWKKNFKITDINKYNLYHPVKNMNDHIVFRQHL